jgi:hypothetical protein
MGSFAEFHRGDYSQIFNCPNNSGPTLAAHNDRVNADRLSTRLAFDCKIHPRCTTVYRCIAENAAVILVAKSDPNEYGDILYSIAIPADRLGSKINALTFSDAMYCPQEVFASVHQKLANIPSLTQQDRSSPCIPYTHDEKYKYDNYTDFLRPFRWGISILEVLRAARELTNPRGVLAARPDSSLTPAQRRHIAWTLLECCKETEQIAGSFMGTLSAGEFGGRLRIAGVSDEIALFAARLVAQASPEAAQAESGFPRYVERALKSNSAQEMKISFNSPRLRAKSPRYMRKGLIDPFFVS